jgi:hypothetical protein
MTVFHWRHGMPPSAISSLREVRIVGRQPNQSWEVSGTYVAFCSVTILIVRSTWRPDSRQLGFNTSSVGLGKDCCPSCRRRSVNRSSRRSILQWREAERPPPPNCASRIDALRGGLTFGILEMGGAKLAVDKYATSKEEDKREAGNWRGSSVCSETRTGSGGGRCGRSAGDV